MTIKCAHLTIAIFLTGIEGSITITLVFVQYKIALESVVLNPKLLDEVEVAIVGLLRQKPHAPVFFPAIFCSLNYE